MTEKGTQDVVCYELCGRKQDTDALKYIYVDVEESFGKSPKEIARDLTHRDYRFVAWPVSYPVPDTAKGRLMTFRETLAAIPAKALDHARRQARDARLAAELKAIPGNAPVRCYFCGSEEARGQMESFVTEEAGEWRNAFAHNYDCRARLRRL
jgi:hypothetical protein